MALHFPPALLCSPRFSSSSCPHNERIIKHRMQQASSCQPSVTEQTGIWTAAQCVWRATDNSWEKDGVTTQHWQHSWENVLQGKPAWRFKWRGVKTFFLWCHRVDTLIVSVAFFFSFFFVPLVNLLDSGYGYMMHTLHGLVFLSLIHLDHLTILSKGKFYLCISY